jgi:hypothetical protein
MNWPFATLIIVTLSGILVFAFLYIQEIFGMSLLGALALVLVVGALAIIGAHEVKHLAVRE